MPTHTAGEIAKFFIDYANKQFVDENGVVEGITNLKLQKILYFAQAAHLSLYDEPLFEEDILAWKFGPVIASVYHDYKQYGNSPLPAVSDTPALDDDLRSFLESVWNIYGKFSAAELVNISHNHLPWKEVFFSADDSAKVISKEAMRSYYKKFFVPNG